MTARENVPWQIGACESRVAEVERPKGASDRRDVVRVGDLLVAQELRPRAVRRIAEVVRGAFTRRVPARGGLIGAFPQKRIAGIGVAETDHDHVAGDAVSAFARPRTCRRSGSSGCHPDVRTSTGARFPTGARYGAIATIDEAGAPQDFVTSGFTADEHRHIVEWSDGPRLFEFFRDLPGPLPIPDVPAYNVRSLGFSPDRRLPSRPSRARRCATAASMSATSTWSRSKGGEAFTDEEEEVLVLFAAQATAAIPVAEASGAGPAPDRPGAPGDAPEAVPILVVDDDPETLRQVRDTLAEAGYAPLVTGDPRELPRIVRAEKLRLVLLDLMLPGTDGIELMQTVPELAGLPVIFISGYGRDETIARALEAGADDYEVKPFSPTELTARIRAARAGGRTGPPLCWASSPSTTTGGGSA